MCNSCNCNKCNCECDNCIADILQVICVLQNSVGAECDSCSCDRPYLGGPNCTVSCNTRPIQIFCGCSTSAITMPVTREVVDCETTPASCSSVLRLEKINKCCATFRVLAPNPDETSTYPYVSTDSIFTININSIGMIRCLDDTFVQCV